MCATGELGMGIDLRPGPLDQADTGDMDRDDGGPGGPRPSGPLTPPAWAAPLWEVRLQVNRALHRVSVPKSGDTDAGGVGQMRRQRRVGGPANRNADSGAGRRDGESAGVPEPSDRAYQPVAAHRYHPGLRDRAYQPFGKRFPHCGSRNAAPSPSGTPWLPMPPSGRSPGR